MSKILILLLFTFALNITMEDGIPVYQIADMKKITSGVYELNVKEGEDSTLKYMNIEEEIVFVQILMNLKIL